MAVEKNLGIVTAYGYAKDKGYQGTEEEFAELMASYATVAQEAEQSAEDSEAYAVGKRNGVDVPISDETYHNNSKYYSQQSSESATNAGQSASDALGYKNDALASKNSASQSATEALGYKNSASSSATDSSTNALKSEGFAVGKQNGTAVGSTSPYYHNNSEYYKNQASQSANNASTSEVNASGSASSASTNALKSEGYAVGQQNGTDVASGSPYYHNNAKYYSEQAAESAASLTIDDELSTSSTNAVQNKVITNELNNKANVDGYYEDLTSGNAEQIVSSIKVTDLSPYNFRTSGGALDIGNRETVKKIVGCSFGWNQLAKELSSTYWIKINGGDTVSFADGVATFTAGQQYGGMALRQDYFFPVVSGHKYLVSFEFMPSADNTKVRYNYTLSGVNISNNFYTNTANVWNKAVAINNCSASGKASFQIQDAGESSWSSIAVRNVNVFDLTLTFTPTIADYIRGLETSNTGDGVAWFRKYFPKSFYANGQSLESVYASAHKMVGFNQWNGTFTVGTRWRNREYESTSSDKYCASPTKMDCFPNTSYCFSLPNKPNGNLSIYMLWFDKDGNYIGETASSYNLSGQYVVFSTDAGAYKMAFSFYLSAGGIQQSWFSEVNVNLHWDGERDGEYEPYDEHVYNIEPVILRGVPKLDSDNNLYFDGDEYLPSGEVNRRFGEIDLGTLTWSDNNSTQFYSELAEFDGATDGNGVYVRCAKFAGGDAFSGVADNVICVRVGTYNRIWIRSSSFEGMTPAQVKTSLNGVKLHYLLATPTTESADSYQSIQIVDNWGTEQYVDYAVSQSLRDVEIPVGSETDYPISLKDKLETLADVPDGDGLYLLKQESGENTYVQYVSPVPTSPSEDGTYVLKCAVSSGVATLSWVSES